MKTLILNSNNIVPNSYNSKLRYEFVGGGLRLSEDEEICLSKLSMYYSNFNFNSSLYNNVTFQYIWVDGVTYTVTIPNSNLSIDELNTYFRSVMVSNLHYLEDTSGNQYFYLQLQLNVSQYSVQFNALLVPTSAQASSAGLTQPAGATWSFPVSAVTPQIVILPDPQNFKSIIGFNAGTYPTSPSATAYSKLSDIAPQVSPVSSFYLTCSLVNNDLINPPNLLYSFTTGDATFGSFLEPSIPEFSWIQARAGYYTSLTVEFLDQNFGQVQIQDSQMTIILGIRKKSEYLVK
jgi:hypothetical protein